METWIGITEDALPVERALTWPVLPGCGAVVAFTGTVRDHAEGRPGVVALEYEAYVEEAEPVMHRIAATAKEQWPGLGRAALLHRTGRLEVGETSVLVAVSAPHRDEAFAAARWCIDTLKATVPIWKRETWADGEGWGTGARPIERVAGGEVA